VLRLADDVAGASGAAAGSGRLGRSSSAGDASGFDLQSAAEWPAGIGEEDVLLSPPQVRSIWRQFMSDSTFAVQQALATQEANRAAQNRLPPLWAIVAMVVLGFNEFMAVLYNPLWLIFLLLLFLFGKTVYQEMDVEREMQRGLLPGAIALSSKFVPALKKVTAQTIDSGRRFLQEAPEAAGAGGGGAGHTAHAGGEGAAFRQGDGSGAGLRARGRREVELSEAGGAGVGTSRFGAEAAAAAGSRKDD
jgi:hypothetical protein